MDYYSVLGVARDAKAEEIRRAYLRLARDRHPDRFSDPEEKQRAQEAFKDITTAFNTLTNERGRREYDAELAHPKATTPDEIAREAYARAVELLQARSYPEAVGLLRAAVHHVPHDAAYRIALAQALSSNPQLKREAVEVLEQAARHAPNNALVHAEQARLLAEQGLRLRARKELEIALRLGPNEARVRKIASALEATLAESGESQSAGKSESGGLLDRLRRRS